MEPTSRTLSDDRSSTSSLDRHDVSTPDQGFDWADALDIPEVNHIVFKDVSSGSPSSSSFEFPDSGGQSANNSSGGDLRTSSRQDAGAMPLQRSTGKSKGKSKSSAMSEEAGGLVLHDVLQSDRSDELLSDPAESEDSLHSSTSGKGQSSQRPAAPKIAPLPSAGSAGHANATCKPCMFAHSANGCYKQERCTFCHYNHMGNEIRRPRPNKAKRERYRKLMVRTAEQMSEVPSAVGEGKDESTDE